jgi:hypothetical protein
MNGVERFIKQNFDEHNTNFIACIQLIIYSYSLLEKNAKYSREKVLNLTTSVRGKEAKKIELEDFLRNDLVKKYIEPNRKLFGLSNYLFILGAEEDFMNIKIGILDIKVCSPLFNGNTYFIFECKRLNKTIIDKYVKEGIVRFVQEQYYRASSNSLAGMIAFLESEDISKKINGETSFVELALILLKYKNEIKLIGKLQKYKLICNNYKYVKDFQHIFVSTHNRIHNPEPIEIFHIVLDYNQIIID